MLKILLSLLREADESRLREVCENFLGPPIGMANVAGSDPLKSAWDPNVLVSLLSFSFRCAHIHKYDYSLTHRMQA